MAMYNISEIQTSLLDKECGGIVFQKYTPVYLSSMAMHKTAYLYSYMTCTIKVWPVYYQVSQLDHSSLMSFIILDVWFAEIKV